MQTDGTLQREQILKAAELREGENIFHRQSRARCTIACSKLPQVDEVQVVRKLPAEIDIQIVERKPIAWITPRNEVSDPFASDAAFLVDARGVLMKEKKLLPEYLGLAAHRRAARIESLEAGKVVDSFEAKAALDLLRLSTRSFMQTRFQIREIDLSKGYCLLVTDKNHTQVTFGFDNLESAVAAPRAISRLLGRFEARTGNGESARAAEYPGHVRETCDRDYQRDDRSGRIGAENFESDTGSSPNQDRIRRAGSAGELTAPVQVRKAIPVHHGRKD